MEIRLSAPAAVPDTYGKNNLGAFASSIHEFMAVDSAPGGDVVQRAGVGTNNFQYLAAIEFFHPILNPNQGHRAQQASGVEKMSVQTYQVLGTSSA